MALHTKFYNTIETIHEKCVVKCSNIFTNPIKLHRHKTKQKLNNFKYLIINNVGP